MAYLLDANVFIEAKDRYYQFKFCPGFWEWVQERYAAGRVFSIDRVGDELAQRDDELATWASGFDESFFLPPDEKVLPALATVAAWVRAQRYDDAAIRTFLEKADYYLVAHALAHGYTVVTEEKPADSPKKVKIPNACIGVGVRSINTFELLNRERARLVLERTGATT
jgi:hypothetical protein